MRITLHESVVERLPDLGDSWARCLAACPPSQQLFTFDWYRAWLATSAHTAPWTGQALVIEVDAGDGAPLAFLPLASRREKGLRVLSLAGFYQPMRTYVCATGEESGVSAALVTSLLKIRSRWDILRLDPYDIEAPERAALVEAFSGRARVLRLPRGRTIVNRINKPYEDFASESSAKRIRSYERRFLREAGNRIEHVGGGEPIDLPKLLSDLGTVEECSWLARQGGDMRFQGEDNRRFWTDVLTHTLFPRRQFEAWVAYAGAKPAAFRVVLVSGQTAYMIANQYGESFAEYRLGWILYLRHVEQACACGIRMIDSAPGDLHYKGRLGGVEAEMRYGIYVFSPTARGAAAAAAFSAIVRLRALLARSPRTAALARYLPRV